VIDYLHQQDFTRCIALHNYSEPLIDPRLFLILDTIRGELPAVSIYILSNGWALDQQMLSELVDYGVDRLWCSAYTREEFRRLKQLRANIDYRVKFFGALDNRLTIYDREPRPSPGPCFAPLWNVVIRHTGDMVLCCNDWDSRHTFGNVLETDLGRILASDEVQTVYKELSEGVRRFPICKRCGLQRGRQIA